MRINVVYVNNQFSNKMLLYITIDMEYLLYFLFMCVYLSNCGIVCENTPSIHFTHNTFILVKNAIDEEVANRFIYELNQMSSNENVK